MLFLLAFLIGSAGLAMLVCGECTFRGRQVPGARGPADRRRPGWVIACLLLVRFVMHLIDRESGEYAPLVFCVLAVIDLGIAAYLFFKVVGIAKAARVKRSTAREPVNPFADQPEGESLPESLPPAPAQPAAAETFPVWLEARAEPKSRKVKGNRKTPFDFS